jgi:putative oxidoreductase
MLKFMDRFRDLGILILRLGIGAMFIYHGWPKINGGAEMWKGIGAAMGNLGINFLPEFWGLMSAVVEFGGGALFALGLCFRPIALLMAFDMAVATLFHFHNGDSLAIASHAIEMGIVFLGAFFIGPGKLSVDEIFFGKKK